MALIERETPVECRFRDKDGSLRWKIRKDSVFAGSSLLSLAIVIIAFLGSISAIRFVTLDDRWYAAWVWSDSWVATAYQFAVAHGRFPKPSTYTFFVPYLFDSEWIQAGIRLSSILLSALIAGNLLQRVLRVRGTGVLFTLFFFAFAQNSFEHNLFVAYPLAWELSWICWMLGLLGLMVAIKTKSMPVALVGTAIWLFGLQEGFVPQTMIFFAVALPASRTERRSWIYLAPYAIGLIIWLAIWLVWRSAHPSTYEGSQLRIVGSVADATRAILTLSIGGMPMASWLQGSWRFTWESFVGSFTTLSAIKALAVFAGGMKMFELAKGARALDNRVRVASLTLTLLVMAFLPNLLVGLTPKYQEWVRLGSHAYLYSHFSYFAWIALGTVCLCAVVRHWPSTALTCILALLAATGSLLTDASNYQINRDQEQFSRRWETMLGVMRSEIFSGIPDGAAIWMADSTTTGSEVGDTEYWQYVVKARTGKSLVFTPDLTIARSASAGAYYLYLYDEQNTENQYVVLAPLDSDPDSSKTRATRFFVFPNTPNKSISISGRFSCNEGDCFGEVSANGRPSAALFEHDFSVLAEASPDKFDVDAVTVEASTPVQVRTIGLNFARNPMQVDAPVVARPTKGFYGWETDGISKWNWATLDSEIEVSSSLDRDIQGVLDFVLVGGDSRVITIHDESGVEFNRVLIDGDHPGHVKIPLVVGKGRRVVRLQSEGVALHEPEARKLAFQLRNLEFHLAEGKESKESGYGVMNRPRPEVKHDNQ